MPQGSGEAEDLTLEASIPVEWVVESLEVQRELVGSLAAESALWFGWQNHIL